MNIIWFSWKDIRHPEAGGAELVSNELMKNLISDGHSVKLLTAHYKDSPSVDTIDGIKIVRVGNRFTVYPLACLYYLRHLRDWGELIIDEMNTISFMTGLYARGTKKVTLAYQLAREIWFYQMPAPVSIIGYLLEPVMLRIMSRTYDAVLTESNSTQIDLRKYGFKNTHTFRVGMQLQPLEMLSKKQISGRLLSLGAVRPMKRTLHAVKAFEDARSNDSSLTLTLAGDISSTYARKVIEYIKKSPHRDAIDIRGRVSSQEKRELMQNSDAILVTSVKEGWGLIVTEANSQGTPAIAYAADGLRDSIQDKSTGYLCKTGDYKAMAKLINTLTSDQADYEAMRHRAWEHSKQFTFKNSYQDFMKIINQLDN